MIRRIAYNEMVCDTCQATKRVWEACPLNGWLIRIEGKPWDGKEGGYLECHYCPKCKPSTP